MDELWSRPSGRTNWAEVDALTDEDIAKAVAEDPDAAPLDIDWSNAVIARVVPKTAVSIRIDPELLAFFKSHGRGYQTRMNAVLRHYMEHELAKARRIKKA